MSAGQTKVNRQNRNKVCECFELQNLQIIDVMAIWTD